MAWVRNTSVLGILWLLVGGLWAKEDRSAKVHDDKKQFQERTYWIYNDLANGVARAKGSNKPLLLVFR